MKPMPMPHGVCPKCNSTLAKPGVNSAYFYRCTSCGQLVHKDCLTGPEKCPNCGNEDWRSCHRGKPDLSWWKRRKLPKGVCAICGDSLQAAPVKGEEGDYQRCVQCGTLYHRECGCSPRPPCNSCGGTAFAVHIVRID